MRAAATAVLLASVATAGCSSDDATTTDSVEPSTTLSSALPCLGQVALERTVVRWADDQIDEKIGYRVVDTELTDDAMWGRSHLVPPGDAQLPPVWVVVECQPKGWKVVDSGETSAGCHDPVPTSVAAVLGIGCDG